MITVVTDYSKITEETNGFLGIGKKTRTFNIDREWIQADTKEEMRLAQLGCAHSRLIRYNGGIYKPVSSYDTIPQKLKSGQQIKYFKGEPCILIGNK